MNTFQSQDLTEEAQVQTSGVPSWVWPGVALALLLAYLYLGIIHRLVDQWWTDPIYSQGWRFFKAVLFPWLFLFLMIPPPTLIMNMVTLPLQFLASDLATWFLQALGVPVLQNGNVIQLSNMSLEVVEACSGIRSLISLGTLAIVYGYLLETDNVIRVLLAIAAVPIAVLANGLRIMGTGLTGLYWDPAKAQGFFHEFSGWVIFVLSLITLFIVHTVLRSLFRALRRAKS